MRRIALTICLLVATSVFASHHKEVATDLPLPSHFNLPKSSASATLSELPVVDSTPRPGLTEMVASDPAAEQVADSRSELPAVAPTPRPHSRERVVSDPAVEQAAESHS